MFYNFTRMLSIRLYGNFKVMCLLPAKFFLLNILVVENTSKCFPNDQIFTVGRDRMYDSDFINFWKNSQPFPIFWIVSKLRNLKSGMTANFSKIIKTTIVHFITHKKEWTVNILPFGKHFDVFSTTKMFKSENFAERRHMTLKLPRSPMDDIFGKVIEQKLLILTNFTRIFLDVLKR